MKHILIGLTIFCTALPSLVMASLPKMRALEINPPSVETLFTLIREKEPNYDAI